MSARRVLLMSHRSPARLLLVVAIFPHVRAACYIIFRDAISLSRPASLESVLVHTLALTHTNACSRWMSEQGKDREEQYV